MRGKLALKYLTNNTFCITPEYLEMMINIAQSSDEVDVQEENANNMVIDGNVAIISVDGAMIKRGDFFSNVCGLTSYRKIEKMIKTAEATEGVDTLLFVIDTPGGDVAGADRLGEVIFNSTLKTVTLYEDLGASAGVWIFSASDEVYATKTTMIGSIGVVYASEVSSDEGKKIEILSSNAPNKRCNLEDKDCQSKIQARIDEIESIFFERVSRNTNLSRDEIIKGFNGGDFVIADKALKIGFLDGITTKDELLKNLKKGDNVKPEEAKILKLLSSHDSEEDKKELTALLATYGVNAVWGEGGIEAKEVEQRAIDLSKDAAKVSALLASTNVMSEAEKIACIEENKSFEDISAIILKKEKGDRDGLDITPPNINKEYATVMIEYAKQNKIRG